MSVLDKFNLSGKYALVTGGGTGIGKAIANGLAEAGADVAVTGRTLSTIEDTAQGIRDIGRESIAVQMDVTNKKSVDEGVDRVIDTWGKLDIAINNSGQFGWIDGVEVDEQDWDRIMDTNVKGVLFCMQAEARVMIPCRSGKIVNNASMSARIVNHPQNQSTYNTSKAAVAHLTRSLAAEWAPLGVKVNSISPGYTVTERTRNASHVAPYRDNWNRDTPVQRPAETSEMVGAVIFLCSGASDFVVGHDLVIDGGFSLW
tara:strand:- start:647 stop:1420 length:774 start_codon:yes stop_codon:yes gene_type:complete